MSYPADPYWSYVKSLLHFDGVHGSTKIVDERHAAWTANGTTLTSLKSKFGKTSLNCDGVSSKHVSASLGPWAWASADATVEFWMFQRQDATNSNPCPVSLSSLFSATGMCFVSNGTYAPNKIAFYLGPNSTTVPLLVSTSSITFDQWTHVAITRSGSVMRLFVNGVLEASVTYAGATLNTSSAIFIGSSGTSGAGFLGYVNDFRYTLGVARYTTTFSPPTTAFPHSGVVDTYYDKVVLHMPCDGEQGSFLFTDTRRQSLTPASSSTMPSINTGSFKFGGSCATLSTANSRISGSAPAFAPEANDFTLEFYFTTGLGTTVEHPLVRLMDAAGVGAALEVLWSPNNYTVSLVVNGATVISAASTGASAGTYKHLAIVRLGGLLRIYVNGSQVTNFYSIGTATIGSNGVLHIGGHPTSTKVVGINIDEFRYTVGVGRYSTGFAALTEPFPQVGIQRLSGTVLDSSNNPISRKVRAFRRSDGLLTDTVMSDPTTGAFELRATDTSEHYVVVFDDTKNAMVYDHIVPVV